MKRIILPLLLFLSLGAIVNVAVAWGLAAVLHPEDGLEDVGEGKRYDGQTRWRVFVGRRCGVQFVLSIVSVSSRGFDGIGDDDREHSIPAEILPYWCDFRGEPISPALLTIRQAYAYGWPAVSLWCVVIPYSDRSVGTQGALAWSDEVWQSLPLVPKLLPLLPAWRGFAINTIFYGVILWGLWFISKHTRRAIRRRRGRCPACAYPRGAPGSGSSGGPVCTECGAALVR